MCPDFQLYLVTDRHLCGGSEPLLMQVQAAAEGGIGAVQLREKDLGGRELYQLGGQLLAICRARGVHLLINDRIDIAMALDADGVHLPANSFSAADARRLLGPNKLIGVSTHSAAEVAAAYAAGADFAVLGPVFSTPSKAVYGAPLGLQSLRTAADAAPIPVFGIGGVDASRAPAVRAAGAAGVAVVSAVLSAADARAAALALRAALSTR